MKFFIDENISIHLARALNHLTKTMDSSHEVVHAVDYCGGRGTPDVVWLEKLCAEGNCVIISRDKFRKGDREILAFRQAQIPIFNLDKQWSKKPGWDTNIKLIQWWPFIVDQVLKNTTPCLYDVPWGVSQGKLKGKRL